MLGTSNWFWNGSQERCLRGEISSWPSSSVWEEVASMLDACVPLSTYWDAPKVLTGLMCVFEELQEVLCRSAKKGNAWLGSVLTSTVSSSVATDTQLEAEDLVRKLEEKLRLENDMQCLGWQERWENRMISRRPQWAILQNWEARGTKAAWIKVQALVTQPDWDAKRWKSWESKENKKEDVTLALCHRISNTKDNKSTATTPPASGVASNSGNVHDERIYSRCACWLSCQVPAKGQGKCPGVVTAVMGYTGYGNYLCSLNVNQ